MVQPGVVNAQVSAGRSATPAALRARPFQRVDLHHRRQRRLQLRRRSLPEIRHDRQPRARHQGRARHRRSRRVGRPQPRAHRPGLVRPVQRQRGALRHCAGDHAPVVASAGVLSHRPRRLSHARTGRDAVSAVIAGGLLPGAIEIMDALALEAAVAAVHADYRLAARPS